MGKRVRKRALFCFWWCMQTTGIWPPASPLSPLKTFARRADPEFRAPMQSPVEEDEETVVGNFQNNKSRTAPRKTVEGLQDLETESQIDNTDNYMPRYKDTFHPKSAVGGDSSQHRNSLTIAPHLPPPVPDAQR